MKKQLLFFVLMLSVALSVFAEEAQIDGLWYNLSETTAEVIRYKNGNKYAGDIAIPSIVRLDNTEYSVTSIGSNAFGDCSRLSSVYIPNSVTNIGNHAFNTSGLKSITIPNSVMTIGSSVFTHCKELISIVVEEGNVKYDSRNNCNAIIETSSNTLIGGCKNTIIPNSVKAIGNNAFCGHILTNLIIPNSVTTIGYSAFWGCTGMTAITIPNSVTSIGNGAFRDCDMTSVSLSNSMTNIGEQLFNSCTRLTTVTIPNNVKIIENYAFEGCKMLSSVNFPNSLITIEVGAFKDCSSLTSITIPKGVTTISNCAFEYCTSLKTATISNSVKNVGKYAFMSCIGLTSVTIGDGEMNIEKGAFSDCSSLINVCCYAEKVPNSDTSIFSYSNVEFATLHVPATSIDAYKATAPWNNFKEIVALTEQEMSVNDIKVSKSGVETRYSIDGIRVGYPLKGLNIIRNMNGKTKKVIIK